MLMLQQKHWHLLEQERATAQERAVSAVRPVGINDGRADAHGRSIHDARGGALLTLLQRELSSVPQPFGLCWSHDTPLLDLRGNILEFGGALASQVAVQNFTCMTPTGFLDTGDGPEWCVYKFSALAGLVPWAELLKNTEVTLADVSKRQPLGSGFISRWTVRTQHLAPAEAAPRRRGPSRAR